MTQTVEVRESTRHRCGEPAPDLGRLGERYVAEPCRHIWVRGVFAWRRTGEVEPTPGIPAPIVSMRLATDGEVTRGPSAVLSVAKANGWASAATYARGTNRTTRGERVVSSVAVRMSRGEARAFGVWLDGRFDMACRWTVGDWPVVCNVGELTAWITGGEA